MDISIISKYRTQLMGIAILWVMFYHSPIHIPDSINILAQIKKMGYGGVDIFMFLSGMGIYYSLNKNCSIKQFYKRRFIRIIPYYTPIVLFYSLFFYYQGDISLSTVFLNITTISFWIYRTGLFEWYIPTILVFYLISPFIFFQIKKENNIVIWFIFIMSLFLFYITGGTRFSYLLMPLGRFPLFLFGFYIGHQIIVKQNIYYNKYKVLLLIISFIFGVYLWNYWLVIYWPKYWSSDNNGYGLSFLPFWLIIFPLCAFLSLALSLIKNYKYPVLTFFGTNTLIFYIFHERIMALLRFYNLGQITLLSFILTIILGLFWKTFIDKILVLFPKKNC